MTKFQTVLQTSNEGQGQTEVQNPKNKLTSWTRTQGEEGEEFQDY